DLSTHTTRFISLALTQKVFANMRRVGKGFSGVETPLFEGMLVDRQPTNEELVADQGEAFPADFQQVLDTCSALIRRVKHLEHDNVAQKLEIVKLKARVKKLEKINKDVFNLGRMMNGDERFELVKDADTEGRQADKQAKIYNIDLDHSSKVLSM
nr:hypothetical protein [Tanacetum cinerariifolium]